jgi:hypothetical protein
MHADMQKRRSILYLFILVLSLALVALLIAPWKLIEKDGRRIALKNIEVVDRMVLQDSYHTTELIRRDGNWHLFGTEGVSMVSVENLLFAAGRLAVASITDPEGFESAGESMEEFREVTFYKGERILLRFRLKKASGKILLHPEGSRKAFYVSLPGYPDLDLERVFSANPDHYREHLLIDLRPSEIRSIAIELAGGESFRFTQDEKGQIICQAANESTRIPEGEPDELAIKLLFSYFTSIRYEQRTSIKADTLLQDQALAGQMARVSLQAFSGEQHSMRVFPYYETPGAEAHLFKALVLYNQEQEALVINYIYLDVLMRGLSHYFGEK